MFLTVILINMSKLINFFRSLIKHTSSKINFIRIYSCKGQYHVQSLLMIKLTTSIIVMFVKSLHKPIDKLIFDKIFGLHIITTLLIHIIISYIYIYYQKRIMLNFFPYYINIPIKIFAINDNLKKFHFSSYTLCQFVISYSILLILNNLSFDDC